MSDNGFQLYALPNYQICNHFPSILKAPPHCLLASAVLKSNTILSHNSVFLKLKFACLFIGRTDAEAETPNNTSAT